MSTTSKFAQAMNASASTWNGAVSYANPDVSNKYTGRISLFFKGVRGLTVPQLYNYLSQCVRESVVDTFLLAFHLRDPRGGKGERELGRRALEWLFAHQPVEFGRVMELIPDYGRWDDLLHLFPGALDITNLGRIFPGSHFSEGQLSVMRENQQELVRIMGKQLSKDVENMMDGQIISLCAKWTPSEKSSLARKHDVFNTLAKGMKISPRKLRTEYNTPLRSYLKIVEMYMCSRQWDNINYNSVPSQAMKKLKKAFEKHSPQLFQNWKDSLKKNDGKAKVNAKAMHPHELISEVEKCLGCDLTVTEAQWKVHEQMVEDCGTLRDCIPVVDTSASMYGLPMQVAIAMGLLIAGSVKGTFHGHVINFHTNPRFSVIPDTDLQTRYRHVKNMGWGGSTNLQATFDMILNRGVECKLTNDDMPKRLFIISDMQFNSIDQTTTNFEYIEKAYRKAGFTRPQIVFWNVNGTTTDFPVTTDHNGTMLISGFSQSILKAVLSGDDDFSTEGVIRRALDDPRYNPVRKALGVRCVEETEMKTETQNDDLGSPASDSELEDNQNEVPPPDLSHSEAPEDDWVITE